MSSRIIARLCVFCGSNHGCEPVYADAARMLGQAIAEAGITVVYGGGRVGLMGTVADAALAAGGEVIGVIPHALDTKELAHTGVTEMHRVNTMHERKALMADLADAFVALPGGLGTFEEFLEIITWAQLGIHSKPCGLLNVAGYYDLLIAFLDNAVARKFVKPQHRDVVVVESEPQRMLTQLHECELPITDKLFRSEDR